MVGGLKNIIIIQQQSSTKEGGFCVCSASDGTYIRQSCKNVTRAHVKHVITLNITEGVL